ncbi:MAG: ParB/RepB/Spo0J family partition protein [Pseudomonas sp.]|uniref:ParB/RepB/Spo0J family partition protein n=1 Tax=Pseudomonas sp. TaxID=306 RepID=UPI001DE6DF10|nr:ParB/RepB/Spo0J family partition protein [Pseudomonas sp.]MPT00281.1 ParB/RepB/Spo0J family partition protein [Pseudomonas sp.]
MKNPHDIQTAAIPTPGSGALMLHVPVLSIARSLRNPRKHFDQAKLQELADSIKATGVHQPILLRPLPESRIADEQQHAKAEKRERAQYELIAGERRWRASQIAGLAEIPAMIRPMSDADALRAAVIENLQRADITKLEEAEGYRELLDLGDTTAEKIAEDVGKSRTYVFNVLKILDLCEMGRDMVRSGAMDWSIAQAVARIPVEALQVKALEKIKDQADYGQPYTARQAQQMTQREFMLRLDRAPFDRSDAQLCPQVGACDSCSYRTGADPEAYADVDSADVCTNPPCYHEKEEAHTAKVRQKAVDQGLEVIDGRAAKELIPHAYSGAVNGYLRLDNAYDSPVTGKTLRKLVHKALDTSGIKPTMIINPHDKKEMIAVVTKEQAAELLKIAGKAEAHQKQQEANERQAKADTEAEKKAAVEEYERAWRREIVRRIAVQSKNPSAALLIASQQIAARNIVNTLNGDDAKELCKMLELGKVAPKDAMRDLAADSASPIAVAGLVLALRDSAYSPWYWEHNPEAPQNPNLMTMAEACGVDIEAVKAETKANLRATKAQAEEKAAAKASESAAPKADLPLDPAARAGESRAKGKAKKSPAARASAEPKTTAAEASAAIAAALQDQESGAAAAAQGNEGAPVAAAQAPIQGAAAAAQGDDAGPVAADAAQDLPPSPAAADVDQAEALSVQQSAPAQTATANDGQGSADAGTGAADQAATSQAPTFGNGDLVRVKAGLKGPTGRPRKECGRVGVVRPGHLSLVVEFGAGVGQRAGFEAEELEPYTADPIVGKRVRVLSTGLMSSRGEFMWREGQVLAARVDGWEIEFAGKPGTIAKTAIFGTEELESLA